MRELQAENRRLREEYARAKQVQYQRTALGLLAVGLVCVGTGIAFPSERTVLLALGATGIFGAILTSFLSPDPVFPSTVGWSSYDAVATLGPAIRDELGLADVSVYVPGEPVDNENLAPVRLFVPQSKGSDVPSREELESTFVVPDDEDRRGVSFTPTAARMLAEFERARSATHSEPGALATQLCDALVEQFELVQTATAEYEAGADRVTVGVAGCAFSSISSFDHPVVSFLGGGFAIELDEPVTVEVQRSDDREIEYLLTCRW